MGWLKKIVPDKLKIWAANKVLDGTANKVQKFFAKLFHHEEEKQEKQIIGPRDKFLDHGPSDRIEKRKKPIDKRGK